MQTLLINPTRRGLTGLAAITLITACGLFLSTGQALAAHCASPYVQVCGPGSPQDVPADPTQGSLSIERVNIGEPFVTCTEESITFVMKVNTFDPTASGSAVLPENAEWQIIFDVMGTDNASHRIYVEMNTFPPNGTPTTPAFGWGRQDPCSAGCGTLDSSQCAEGAVDDCPTISGTVAANGTLTIKLRTEGAFIFPAPGEPGVGTAFTWDASSPGKEISNIVGNTFLLIGVGAGLLANVESTTGTVNYTTMGNVSCAALPIAVLEAMPTSGSAPLQVTFDATDSTSNPCSALNSYTLNFGDGSPPATQTTPIFPPHTYTTAGNYTASLTVKNAANQVSTNTAQVLITVTSANAPQLAAVNPIVSRKVHGGTNRDINLPLTGNPGIECRTGGGSNNHTMVFTFVNNLTSVGGASVTTGTGSVGSSSINGANPKQYIVNLTGVTNAQRGLTVTLNSVQDSTGANGTILGKMSVLLGDTTASGSVNSSDIGQTKSQSGQTAGATNFRTDVTVSGSINSSDIGLVKSKSGTNLP